MTSAEIRIQYLEETVHSANQTIARQNALIQALTTELSSKDPDWCYLCDRPNYDCACEEESQ